MTTIVYVGLICILAVVLFALGAVALIALVVYLNS